MLAPTERSLLLDHFRPPDGYRFDSALGTTYSLDVVALMMVPLAFTFLDIETAAGDPVDDAMAPRALLEALRRYASGHTSRHPRRWTGERRQRRSSWRVTVLPT